MSLLTAGCNSQKERSASADYIRGIAIDAQREVVRGELGLEWPLEVGKGNQREQKGMGCGVPMGVGNANDLTCFEGLENTGDGLTRLDL
jgi:hypothetical protein